MRNKWIVCLSLVVCLMVGAVAFAQDVTPEATPGPLAIGDVTGGNAANYYGQEVTLDGKVDELVNVRSFLLGGGGLNNPQVLVLNNSGQEFDIGLTKDAAVRVTGTIYPSYNQGGWDQISTIANTGGLLTGTDMTGMDTLSGMDTTMGAVIGADTTGADTMGMGGADTTGMMATEGALIGSDTMTGMDTTGMDTTGMTGTDTNGMTSMSGWVGLDQYPLSILTDRFPDHTIFVISSIEAIEYLPNPGAGVTETPAPAG